MFYVETRTIPFQVPTIFYRHLIKILHEDTVPNPERGSLSLFPLCILCNYFNYSCLRNYCMNFRNQAHDLICTFETLETMVISWWSDDNGLSFPGFVVVLIG